MITQSSRSFFPATCHPPLTRRQLLVAGGAALASVPLGRGGRRAHAKAKDDGASIVRRHAAVRDDPWLAAHGVRAMGREFALPGGRRVVDHLLENVLTTVPAGGKPVLGFPLDVEVHPNAFLKTMLEAGVPLDYAFTHKGSRRTLQDVVSGARALFRPTLVVADANALPWTLIALTRTTSTMRRQWTNGWGEPVDLDALVEAALRLLEQASQPLMQAMQDGQPETRQVPVHGFTCGGTHLIYGLLAAMYAGYTGKDRSRRMQQQADLLLWRLSAEPDFIERFFRSKGNAAGDFWYEFDAKFKLLGHGAECLAFALRHDVVKLSPAQQAQWQGAEAGLRRMLVDLEERNLGEAKTQDRELYRQLVGDTCHARHGLTLT